MCTAIGHVRFTPNSDRKSGFPHNARGSKCDGGHANDVTLVTALITHFHHTRCIRRSSRTESRSKSGSPFERVLLRTDNFSILGDAHYFTFGKSGAGQPVDSTRSNQLAIAGRQIWSLSGLTPFGCVRFHTSSTFILMLRNGIRVS